jgi:cytosol alanyl aminopeptidase
MVGRDQIEGRPFRRPPEKGDELLLYFPREVPRGPARLSVVYDGPFEEELENGRGLLRVEDAGRWLAFSNFEPCGARKMFPSFDEPGFKVPFDVTITTPPDLVAFANMPEISRTKTERGIRFRFARSPPLSTYLVALAVGDFDVDSGPLAPVPIRLIRPKGSAGTARSALDAAAELTRVLATYFAYPFPFPKIDLVAIPKGIRGAMENPGLITTARSILLLENGNSPVWAQRERVHILAHELAHQWVGNLVTLRWWDDIWLNEGFATFLAARALDIWRPSFGARLEEALNVQFQLDGDSGIDPPVRAPVVTMRDAENAVHGAVPRVKGASFLSMVERYVGEEAFLRGVRQYVRDHAYGSVGTPDLVSALEKASGRPLAEFAQSFLEQAGSPALEVEAHCAKGQLESIGVHVRSNGLVGRDDAKNQPSWAIPFCYTAAETTGIQCERVLSEETVINPPMGAACPQFLDPNPGLVGYYRYGLTKEQLRRASDFVGRLSPEARLGLLASGWEAAGHRELPPEAMLRLLSAFDQETNHTVLWEVVGILRVAQQDFVSEEMEEAFHGFVRARMAHHKSRLGLGPSKPQEPLRGHAPGEDDNTSLARAAIAWPLGLAGDADILAASEETVRRWIKQPDVAIDPEVGDTALALAARHFDSKLFGTVALQVERPARPDNRQLALAALAYMEDPALLRRAFELALRLDLDDDDVDLLLRGAAARTKSRRVLVDWITSEWERIRTKWGKAMWSVAKVIRFTCDDAQRSALQTAFARSYRQWPWLDRQVEAAIRCRDMREFGAEGVARYLTSAAMAQKP